MQLYFAVEATSCRLVPSTDGMQNAAAPSVFDCCVVKLAHFKGLVKGRDHEEVVKSELKTSSFIVGMEGGRRITCLPFRDTAAPVHHSPTKVAAT